MSPPAVPPQTSHAAAPHYIIHLADAFLFKVIYSTYYRDNLLMEHAAVLCLRADGSISRIAPLGD